MASRNNNSGGNSRHGGRNNNRSGGGRNHHSGNRNNSRHGGYRNSSSSGGSSSGNTKVMFELMAFSATVDSKTLKACRQSFTRQGAPTPPDVSLQVYPKGTDVGSENIQAAMKQALYQNVRKLHCEFRLDNANDETQCIIYRYLVTVLMWIHSEKSKKNKRHQPGQEPVGDAAEGGAGPDAEETEIDQQSVAFFWKQEHCMSARKALARIGVRVAARTGVPKSFKAWSTTSGLPNDFEQLLQEVRLAPAAWEEYEKQLVDEFKDAPDKQAFLRDTAKSMRTEFTVKQEVELERFSVHLAQILLTTSVVDRGYDNSCLELVVLNGVPPNYDKDAQGLAGSNDPFMIPNMSSFVHRVGRVGRYGKHGVALVVSRDRKARARWRATADNADFNLKEISRDPVLNEIRREYNALNKTDQAAVDAWRQKAQTNPEWTWLNSKPGNYNQVGTFTLTEDDINWPEMDKAVAADNTADLQNMGASGEPSYSVAKIFSEPFVEYLKREIVKEDTDERLPNAEFSWAHMSEIPRKHPTWTCKCGGVNADFRAHCLRCPQQNPAGAAAAQAAAVAYAQASEASIKARKAADLNAQAAEEAAAQNPTKESVAAAKAAKRAATKAAMLPTMLAPFPPMLNYHLAVQYSTPEVDFEKPSLVQQKLLREYFGADLKTGRPGIGPDARSAPGFVLQATNGAGKTGAMVLGALMRLFPRTSDKRNQELNYCTVDPAHVPVVLLTTDEIIPQIHKHVVALTSELHGGPPDADGNQPCFHVYRSRADDLRLGAAWQTERSRTWRENGYAAAYQRWRAEHGRHAHFLVISPKAFVDMLLTADPDRNIRTACAGLRCLVIDEVDALLSDSQYISHIKTCLKQLRTLTR